jgi:hypothetical protein
VSATTTAPWWIRLWLELKALALPIGTYWAANAIGLAVFNVIVVVLEPANDAWKTAIVVAGCWIGTFLPIALGQLLALARLRTMVVIAIATTLWAIATGLLIGQIVSLAPADGTPMFFVMVVLFILVLIGPFFLACGHWSLTTNMEMLATFAPIVWITAAILTIADKNGSEAAWEEGRKYAVWNVLTTPILGVGILMILAYLASRELHRLFRWRTAPMAPDLVVGGPVSGLAQARATPGCGGLAMILALGLVLTIASAMTAPYLWRTAQDDANNGGDDPSHQEPDPYDGGGGGGGGGGSQRLQQMMQQAQQAMQQTINAMLMLLMMLFLAVVGVFVFGPPLRRMLLLQYLRRPYWPVAPTRRVQQHWRLVEIALADAGVHREPGDSATALVRRAAAQIDFIDPEALHHCAAIADRVVYGMGMQADDIDMARRTAEMTFQTVWDEMSERQKFVAMYRVL